ncbi:hypothetical protein FQZ97_1090140 [compost metagenome]
MEISSMVLGSSKPGRMECAAMARNFSIQSASSSASLSQAGFQLPASRMASQVGVLGRSRFIGGSWVEI